MMLPAAVSTKGGECRQRKLARSGRRQGMLFLAVDEHWLPGQVISGRFRLERLLGRGGMGTVWEARHLSLQTQIAIKFLNSDLSRRHDVLARFAREATSAARIRSPHVVSILDSGFTDDGHGFIAMELLRGDDLGRRLARFVTLTVSETALLVTQVARGLAKAHSVGVVHRDLKPENIFIVDEDDAFIVKILDFGIAKSIGTEAVTHKTDTGQLLGTPLYMSPEQALGRSIDSRSDLYSLAVVAYRCLAGRPPFTYSAVGELIVAVSTHEPPAPSQFNPSLSPAIDAWFAGALAKDPSERSCQSAGELAESFNRACGEALDSLLPSADSPRTTPPRQSYPPLLRSGSTEVSPPSQEEIATTVVAAQLPFSRPVAVRGQRARRWWPALATVLAAGAATTAFRSHARHATEPAQQKVVSQVNPARPALAQVEPTAAPSAAPSASASPEASVGQAGARNNDLARRESRAAPPSPRAPNRVAVVDVAHSSEAPPPVSTDSPAPSARESASPAPTASAKPASTLPPIDRSSPW
jgi:serine/threonine protein kinase